jgi:uncharacterized protein (DUF2267 family)
VNHDEFIGQVQSRARLASRGDAERATRATLETLGERLSGGAAQNLAAQLPTEIGEHLRRVSTSEEATGDSFSLDEFFDRVAERENAEVPEAAFHARTVIEVAAEATTGGVVTKVREQLPDDFNRLFEAGSTGRMN